MTDPLPAQDPAGDPAMRRFFTLHVVRIAGAVIMGAGVLLWQTDKLSSVPSEDGGKALFALGLFVMLVVPALLRRRWRTKD